MLKAHSRKRRVTGIMIFELMFIQTFSLVLLLDIFSWDFFFFFFFYTTRGNIKKKNHSFSYLIEHSLIRHVHNYFTFETCVANWHRLRKNFRSTLYIKMSGDWNDRSERSILQSNGGGNISNETKELKIFLFLWKICARKLFGNHFLFL